MKLSDVWSDSKLSRSVHLGDPVSFGIRDALNIQIYDQTSSKIWRRIFEKLHIASWIVLAEMIGHLVMAEVKRETKTSSYRESLE